MAGDDRILGTASKGFLGASKTTLCHRLSGEYHGQRIAALRWADHDHRGGVPIGQA